MRYAPFRPRRIVVEEDAAGTPLARRFPHAERVERFAPEPLTSARAAKSTLVIRRWRAPRLEKFTYCEDFSFHLAAGCPLHCSYCTLLYRLPRHPYVQAYANVEEILEHVTRYVRESPDETTVLVVGDNTDVLAMEPLLGTLRTSIEHFGRVDRARLEFLTKAPEVETILDADHRGRTSVGYSLNTPRVIEAVEHGTGSLDQRLASLRKALDAGYPVFLNFAPIFPYEEWEEEYAALLERCRDELGDPGDRIRMECEIHWQKAEEVALSERLYPQSDQALLQHGKVRARFADGSVLHRVPDDTHERVRAFFEDRMARLFPRAASRLFCPPADPKDRPQLIPFGARP